MRLCAIAVMIFAGIVCVDLAVHSQPRPATPTVGQPAATQPPRATLPQPTGRLLENHARDKVHRFPQPVTNPPTTMPPPRPGETWCWHPYHGWLGFPVAVFPKPVILAANYALPATVTYYQVMTPEITVICPDTGRVLRYRLVE